VKHRYHHPSLWRPRAWDPRPGRDRYDMTESLKVIAVG
jgi:hypothetical protein